MKKLIAATASVLALGITGPGVGHAADPYKSSITAPGPAINVSEDQIKAVQQQLKTAGFYNGSIDGKMGADTKQGIAEFQRQNRLPQTGTLDQQTLGILQNNAGGAGSNVAPPGQPSSAGGLQQRSNPQGR